MPTPIAYSIAALSIELGRDRVKLGKALAGVEPDQIKGERKLYLIKTVVDRLVDGDATRARTDKELADHKIKDAKGELLVMELRERQGKMVEIKEVQGVLGDVLTAVRARLLAIPTRLAQRLAGTKDPKKARALMDKAVRSALEEVSTFDPSNLKLKGAKK